MKPDLSRAEKILFAFCAALLAMAAFGPPLAQPAHFHDFADQRAWLGLPCALDVLSNLPFAVGGVWGLIWLRRVPTEAIGAAERQMATLFFAGLLFTAAGSGYYHWQPDNTGLAIDRSGMLVAFAGLLGLAAAGRVSERAGRWLAAGVLLFGAMGVVVWLWSGNLLPWAVLQAGGMVLVLWLAASPSRQGALAMRWVWVIAIYALAKLLELADDPVFEATGGLVSGHTLKHLVASLAAWPVIAAVGHTLAGAKAAQPMLHHGRMARNAAGD